jgi:hypothetical protein
MPIKFKEENGGKVPVHHDKMLPPKSDYGDFITEFKRLLKRYGEPRKSKQVTNVPTKVLLLYLIRHGATRSFTNDGLAVSTPPHLPETVSQNLNNHATAATDSNLLQQI